MEANGVEGSSRCLTRRASLPVWDDHQGLRRPSYTSLDAAEIPTPSQDLTPAHGKQPPPPLGELVSSLLDEAPRLRIRSTSNESCGFHQGLPRKLSSAVPVWDDDPAQVASRSPQARVVEPAPLWDEASGRFWCAADVNAYDIPDGGEWQSTFRGLLEHSAQSEFGSRARQGVQRQLSDSSNPVGPGPGRKEAGAGRKLARFPSDPDKRTARALHTSALIKMPCHAGIQAVVQGRLVAFFRFYGKIFATDARCPHQGGILAEGEIGDIEDMVDGRRHYVTCPVHKMQFDLSTGEVIDGDCPRLQTYDVRIREADDVRKVAMVEVGFESLTWDYFAGGDAMDMAAGGA